MRPLDPLPALEDLLRRSPAAAARAELTRLDAAPSDELGLAARCYGHGALALREGRFAESLEFFEKAEHAFLSTGEEEAAQLTRAEFWLGRVRLGGKAEDGRSAGAGYALAIGAFRELSAVATTRRVRVVANHYLGSALRYAGRAEETQEKLLEALAESNGLLPERAQILNSLGTLYVLLGAHGAARSLLEHAADLARSLKDTMGEAIACGQLGTAALAQGEREAARRFLQRQEWLAATIDDAFGRSRSLVLLAELALDLGRADEAIELATRALNVATSVSPPLTMWVAYAQRVRGRAKSDLGDASGAAELDEADRLFQSIGNKLGAALLSWDRARLGDHAEWARAAWALGSLGLEPRVAQLLFERRQVHGLSQEVDALDSALAACAQSFAHLAAEYETELLYRRPLELTRVSARRVGGQRNRSRLAALVLAPPGLVVAALTHARIGADVSAMPSSEGDAVCLGAMPSLVLWGWRGDVAPVLVARDIASLRAACPGVRVALGYSAHARVTALGMAGEPSATVAGLDVESLIARAVAAPPGEFLRDEAVPWDADARSVCP
jgi:tetratricopeptide (TPR) repeat protein